MSTNPILLQGFEWYAPADGQHWKRLAHAIPRLRSLGMDYLWLPPGCKAGWHGSNGYDVYDMYDLGEFDQKGSVATKWGTKQELLEMMRVAREYEVGVLWDAVLNHKSAADYTERCMAVVVDKENRLKEIGPPREVDVWTGYEFAARGGRYSQMKYRWHHFSGTDWEARLQTNEKLYQFVGPGKPGWARDVDDSEGNADYLMGNDLDYSSPEVRGDMKNWGLWMVRELGLSGFRLDAVKHFSSDFLREWIQHLDHHTAGGRPLLMIGEYWRDSLRALGTMIEKFRGRLLLFDVMLATNFSNLSIAADGDMRGILSNTLAKHYPGQAVTFVLNHDTQSRYERDHEVTAISPWFIPLAYALILLRTNTGLPCVFYGDLYGIQGDHPVSPSCRGQLPKLLLARKVLAHGTMHEYLDHRNCIGFTREGDSGARGGTPEVGTGGHGGIGGGLAVTLNNSPLPLSKRMYVGIQHAREQWTDILGFAGGTIFIDPRGWASFPSPPRGVAVWASAHGAGREGLDRLRFDNDIYNIATV